MIALGVIALLIIAAGCAAVRLLRGPTLSDRIVALDVGLVALMGALTVEAIRTDSAVLLDALVVIAIVGFTATVAGSQFIERHGVDR